MSVPSGGGGGGGGGDARDYRRQDRHSQSHRRPCHQSASAGAYDSASATRRRIPTPLSYDPRERLLGDPYDRRSGRRPSDYTGTLRLDYQRASNYIPPPDQYLSPPAPAPPDDRFQPSWGNRYGQYAEDTYGGEPRNPYAHPKPRYGNACNYTHSMDRLQLPETSRSRSRNSTTCATPESSQYQRGYSTTLPRCSSYGDVQCSTTPGRKAAATLSVAPSYHDYGCHLRRSPSPYCQQHSSHATPAATPSRNAFPSAAVPLQTSVSMQPYPAWRQTATAAATPLVNISPCASLRSNPSSITNTACSTTSSSMDRQSQTADLAEENKNHGTPSSLPSQGSYEMEAGPRSGVQYQTSSPVSSQELASVRQGMPVRTESRRGEMMKNYIKREAAQFFGVYAQTEEGERLRWLDRRKRLATRKYGELKPEYKPAVFVPREETAQPDVLPCRAMATADERDHGNDNASERRLVRKPSVATMTMDGVCYIISTLNKQREKPSPTSGQWSRSYPKSSVPSSPSIPLEDEVFFDGIPEVEHQPNTATASTLTESGYFYQAHDAGPSGCDSIDCIRRTYGDDGASSYYTWQRPDTRPSEVSESQQIGSSRMLGEIVDRVLDNSDRRLYGMGVVGQIFGRSLKRSVMNREPVKGQLEDLEDHRPFFTYWVTTVQIFILFLSMCTYGLGPIGLDLTQQSGLVLVTSLSLQQVEFSEPSNFWVGPRAADLIHMGAKFAPCMRKDKKIMKEIEKMRDMERGTACCIRNDDSGCVQASQSECSESLSTWKKWSVGESGPGGRLSGSVCGLDPKFCETPASVAPFEWPDDITKWPICKKINARAPATIPSAGGQQHVFRKDSLASEHMICEVIGHPCCIGIHGTCRITTREYCDFVRGHFHEDASLCSQVFCLENVCGMIPFFYPEHPDQFYRLWTSLFIHAGIIHLAITVVIQYYFMRDLEKLTGSTRIAVIYMGSGVAGNLASSIFVPYRADVGPAGSQFGLLACLIVEVLNCWPMLKRPRQALMKLLTVTGALFVCGLLPWVDNFAHLFGFVFGFLLSYALLPFVSFGPYDRQKKIFLIWVCLLSSLFLFLLLLLLFYLTPIYDCEICRYFNCIPLTRDFCATQNINFKKEQYIV